jgi:signal transduction histidine kinase
MKMIQAMCNQYTQNTQYNQYNQLLLEAIAGLRSIQELPELYEQTAHRFAAALGVSKCLILDRPLSQFSTVVAVADREASQESLLGQETIKFNEIYAQKALTSLHPITLKNLPSDRPFPAQSLMIMATSYRQEPNALIYLYQCDRPRSWTETELEFVEQLAAQVGYYIAHLTRQEELEASQKKVKQATSTIEKFLQNISDKLRNPMNAIIGSLTLVLDDVFDDPEEQREFIQDAHRSSLELLHTINDLLHFSNLRHNQMSKELGKPVKLSKILNEVERLTQARAEHQNLYLNIIKPSNYDDIILSANESRLLQVFLNVVGNGIKFTHAGGVTITCKVIAEPAIVHHQEYPGWVEIRVSDTGIGVPSEYLPRVFEPFFQVHDPRTSPYPGTGLGLSISKKLIELMGGEVHFYSMGEGLGSTTIFTVPLYQTPLKIYGAA